ncbi:MAG: selenide, water dikinase SelD [Pseudomonadota bacterium]
MQATASVPITRDLVLLGGGHTHALVLRKWAMDPLAGVQVTLVNPDVKAPYTGMLPGFVAGHYSRDELDIDLVRLARRAGARLIVDRAVGIDTGRKRVHLANRPDILYDTLSFDVGISSHVPTSEPGHPAIIPAKPLGPFADKWSALIERSISGGPPAKVGILGGGVAGVELALAMAHRLEAVSAGAPCVQIIESGDTLLRELNASARRSLISELAKAGIQIDLQANMSALSADIDFIVSAAGAAPHAWIAETGLSLEAGYIEVDKYLRSTNTPDVFAAGDCAHLSDAPRPKAGVFAVRQAPALFHNLRAQLSGGDFTSYAPQDAYLKLISLGRTSAVTDKWGIGLSGDWVWRWKNRIDQAFMRQFQEPDSMPSPKRPHDMALGATELLEQQEKACGACGAKVAQTFLTDGLSDAGLAEPPEDAAIIQTDTGFEVFTTDHLRAFNPDPYTLARIAAVHALGDIWAMGGRPKTVLSQLILPPLAPAKQSAMIAEITAGANAVFAACDTQISGGHSSNGTELTIGFSISASLRDAPITQSGAEPGNVLILTKPIGTGVLLAAEMRQLADGGDVQAALTSMCRLQDQAAALLAQKATAMTDVTGFGLAGHLLNILTASGVAAALDISSIPTLSGASFLSGEGVRSTLWLDNARHAAAFIDAEAETTSLLFDPQTGGGLLAAIPEESLPDMLQQFESANEPIWPIGRILDGPVRIYME